MYSAAPLSLKLAALFLAIVGLIAMGAMGYGLAGNIYVGDRKETVFLASMIAAVGLVVFGPMMRAVVRGRLPYVFMAALVALGLWGSGSLEDILIVVVPCLVFAIPFIMPASRRWCERCRLEDAAYRMARRSGVDLSALQMSEHPLKCSAASIFFIVSLGLFLGAVQSTCAFVEELYDPNPYSLIPNPFSCLSVTPRTRHFVSDGTANPKGESVESPRARRTPQARRRFDGFNLANARFAALSVFVYRRERARSVV